VSLQLAPSPALPTSIAATGLAPTRRAPLRPGLLEVGGNDEAKGLPDNLATASISPKTELPADEQPRTKSIALGRLSNEACLKEATARGLPFATVDSARGVETPVRLRGSLNGVSFQGLEGQARQATSVFEILDCRLLLALDNWSAFLAKRHIKRVLHMSMYRPPPRGQAESGKRHSGALAIDVGHFVRDDDSKINVEKDFFGTIGKRPCPAPSPRSEANRVLRELVCEAVANELFHVVLTPGYNRAHHNHLHLEIAPNSDHVYVR
jgi:hypothetical protein